LRWSKDKGKGQSKARAFASRLAPTKGKSQSKDKGKGPEQSKSNRQQAGSYGSTSKNQGHERIVARLEKLGLRSDPTREEEVR
jgi:hypothetical protein